MEEATFTADEQTLEYKMTTGGVFTGDVFRTTGDGTFTLQTKPNEDSDYADYYDENGSKVEFTLGSSQGHCRLQAIGRKDQWFQVISSSTGDTPNFPATVGRASAGY